MVYALCVPEAVDVVLARGVLVEDPWGAKAHDCFVWKTDGVGKIASLNAGVAEFEGVRDVLADDEVVRVELDDRVFAAACAFKALHTRWVEWSVEFKNLRV